MTCRKDMLYYHALTGDPDCGNTVVYNFLSGEPVAGAENGRPMYFRTPDGKFNLANLFRAEIYSTMAALKLGMDILFEKEQVSVEKITGHGGLFKTPEAGQKIMAAAIGVPVSVMENAGEGGAWGIALLAEYMLSGEGMTLAQYMEQNVFTDMPIIEKDPAPADIAGFTAYMHAYQGLLAVEETAIQAV